MSYTHNLPLSIDHDFVNVKDLLYCFSIAYTYNLSSLNLLKTYK